MTITTIMAAALVAQSFGAGPQSPQPTPTANRIEQNARPADKAAILAVLKHYQSAIERLDAGGTEHLFAAESAIFETGGAEGSYDNYLAHHLGPELKEFKSFKFSNYSVDVRFEGPVALAAERYEYRIETLAGVIADRIGVTTTVLKKVGGQWKILISHNSARKPKGDTK